MISPWKLPFILFDLIIVYGTKQGTDVIEIIQLILVNFISNY